MADQATSIAGLGGSVVADRAVPGFSAVIAQLGHDLRTPLNAILGYSQLLMEEPQEWSVMRDDLLRIWQAGKTLLTDIDLIVEWAKWDSGQISGGRGPVDLVDILDAALVTAASQLAEAGRSLSWPEDAGTGVQCDGDLLARVITDWLDYLIASSEGTVFCTVNPDASTVQIILTASLGQRAWEEVAWASAPYQMGGRVPGVEWLKTGVTLQRDRAILVAMGGTLDVGEREGSMALTIRLPRAM